MITIIGSGFGLYGYLPAVIKSGVVLPLRYKEKLDQMPQAKQVADLVQWVADDQTARAMADTAIIAVPPEYQPKILDEILVLPNIQRIALEKPLAPTPDIALAMMEKLERSGKQFRIDYIFRFTDWGEKLLAMPPDQKLNIEWQFMAHHFAHQLNNWRRYSETGGGAVRFYGIHFIALLAEMGYTEVISSETDKKSSRWKATFTGPHLPDCHLLVDTKATNNKFTVKAGDTVLAEQESVFVSTDPNFDVRVPVVAKFYASFADEPPKWYRAAILLWKNIECATPAAIR